VSGHPWLSATAALAAAVCFGTAGSLQHIATWQVPRRQALHPRLLVDLAHRPWWLLSLLAAGLGAASQAVALGTGPLILVQPLLVTGLLFAVLSAALLRHRRVDGIVLLGAVLCVAGLAGFLALAQPLAGENRVHPASALPLAAGLALVLATCFGTAVRRRGRMRALALAVACGVLYGITAGIAKLVLAAVGQGASAVFGDWPVYLLIVLGPMGFLVNQNAFQAGAALAPVLAVITVLDPLVSIGIGILWLGEHLRGDPGAVAGQILSLTVLTVGVGILAHRAPQSS
jgi:drug/metabolite transporter (DMT)-like permease